jgi:hypothetical protein
MYPDITITCDEVATPTVQPSLLVEPESPVIEAEPTSVPAPAPENPDFYYLPKNPSMNQKLIDERDRLVSEVQLKS